MRGPKLPKDSGEAISPEEWMRAIKYLLEKLPKEVLTGMRDTYKRDPAEIDRHPRDWGVGIRNMIRAAGFTWGSIALDENWADLLRDALDTLNKQ
jgi:hypothetical protein